MGMSAYTCSNFQLGFASIGGRLFGWLPRPGDKKTEGKKPEGKEPKKKGPKPEFQQKVQPQAEPEAKPEEKAEVKLTPDQEAAVKRFQEAWDKEALTLTEEQMANLPPEQAVVMAKEFLKKLEVPMDGKMVNVWDHAHELARKAEYEQERHAQGLDEATVREDPAWVHNLKIDINELRGNEWKMMLRPEDQDELPLEMLGKGNVWSPMPLVGMMLGGKRDWTFGIYGDTDHIRTAFSQKYKNIRPDKVLEKQELYDDIISVASDIELTLMVIPMRRINFDKLVGKMWKRMARTLAQEEKEKGTSMYDLDTITRRVSASHRKARDTTLLDRKLRSIPDTQYIFTIVDFGIKVHAISADPIKSRKAWGITLGGRPEYGQALMKQFLGPDPIDPLAKRLVGQAVLFVANNFELHRSNAHESVANQHLEGEDGNPDYPSVPTENVVPSLDIFEWDGWNSQPQLLNGLKSAQKGKHSPGHNPPPDFKPDLSNGLGGYKEALILAPKLETQR